ncbi:carboxyl-terminal processing protease [Bryocella elongata]|uniref:Carboxyl-terminal processing protease n=1 Tax=Bryocella elongata TaxID=863522 RepID=A0A1H6B6T6_9BACT|nr:S41 family peptidase [Bryocella elongata]SEG56573.1 carboxyl-terminal processing protease [Bryocella elongata]
MPKSLKISLLAVSVMLVVGVFLGVNARGVHAAGDAQQEGAYRQINVYGEVLQHIETEYVVDPNMHNVTNGALRGLLESLDADSSYLTPEDYKAYRSDKGGKAQVGINISKRYGYATVVSVIANSPADKASIADGDIIEAIGTQDTRDLSLAMIQTMLEGAPGSELHIAVIRPRKAEPEKITLSRVMISEPAVSETLYENSSIVYLAPGILDKDHVNQMEQKLKTAAKSNRKVLLDLREVSAGSMEEGVRAANLFLKSGTIATLEGQKFPKQTFGADASKAADATSPLVVLVNRGTAGPAELLAAAIADNHRGDLVGEKTFGEGTEQKTFELSDGGAVILSIAKYASPAGKKFEDDAVTPATVVAANDDLSADSDSSDSTTKTPTPPKKPTPAQDNVLNKGLDLLKAKAA